ncbi:MULTISPECIES: molybdate ABC transporter substrate-binding protein [unclassified Thiomonas]|uniref:molybdate ABC transporter substrate-binding protein n=1 Tax=unclassified Thiomonas TaxID=2625466 RepID=UPI0004DBC32C|nr:MULTISPECIES: molybdate ABC transporter substrate-binding protein [unclassified Thiomonas]CDW92888.1 ABC-type molybdate transport system, periplasmic component modA [Thiomonas sp. CB2]VDY05404.1 Molybdenum ABC transporter, periplasmic molybdate-binding protein [Thiomonas sp. Bio17B3]VDY07431.1 Molybdenum ABC transporter, periplasmic molybdate-binding protein [Thiomonas sp. Sup16B3]VDY13655.1 putative ABC-type molybdate transport system, periplasmic component modA [Thiomonas sp. OC7]VDY17144
MQTVLLTRRRLALGGLMALLPAARALAADPAGLLLMAGAGYKRPVEALCADFTRETGIPVERSYGNLQQIFAQARASGRVDVLIGDADFIDHAKDLSLPQRQTLGQGKLVLAWRRKLLGRRSPDPITDPVRDLPEMQSITLPNPQQAIYGRAAEQWLKAKGLWAPLQDKLKIVQTVPQVSAYLTSGQIDAGFLNLTEVLAVKGQLGGYLELQPGADSYAPIDIVAAFPAETAQPETAASRARFAQFLQGVHAQEILRRAGL